jgi:large subunit ribosomal protein L10e
MARLRKGISYRTLDRPYTRVSKFKKKSFIKMTYNTRITKFVMGNLQKEDWECKVKLQSKTDLQIRDNAIEAARQTSNRLLEKTAGPTGYFLRVNKYPYHVLRMHALASGAGADRFSTGMAHPFGKPTGQAIQLLKGQTLFEVGIDKKNIDAAKKALNRAAKKIACSYSIVVEQKQKVAPLVQ